MANPDSPDSAEALKPEENDSDPAWVIVFPGSAWPQVREWLDRPDTPAVRASGNFYVGPKWRRRAAALWPEYRWINELSRAIRARISTEERRRKGEVGNTVLSIRVPDGFGERCQDAAEAAGMESVSEWICDVAGRALAESEREAARPQPEPAGAEA